MPKFNPDNLNIQELAVEEPEKETELSFDLEKYITKNDWNEIYSYIEGKRKRKKLREAYFHSAAYASFLDGSISIPQEETDKQIAIVNKYREMKNDPSKLEDNYAQFAHHARYLKLLKIPFKVTEIDKQEMQKTLDYYWKDTNDMNWEDAVEHAADMAIVTGEKTPLNYFGQTIFDGLEHCRNNRHPLDFLAIAYSLKILGAKVKVNKEMYNSLISALDDLKVRRVWSLFLLRATELKILMANEIEIPKDGGLELVDNKKITKPETPDIPKQKEF